MQRPTNFRFGVQVMSAQDPLILARMHTVHTA